MKAALIKVPVLVLAGALIAGCVGTRVHKGAVVDRQLVRDLG